MENEPMDVLSQYPDSVMEKGYGMVGKLVMQDRSISIEAKGLYAYICTFGNVAFPGRKKIMEELQIGKNSYTKYLKELVVRGYVSVQQKRDGEKKQFLGNVYTININPQEVMRARAAQGKEIVQPQSPRPKISDTEPCPKICDTQENQGFEPRPKLRDTAKPYTVNSDTNITTANNITSNNTTTAEAEVAEKPEPASAGNVGAVVAALCDLDVEKKAAMALVRQYGAEAVGKRIAEVRKKSNVGNAAGWVISALRKNYAEHPVKQEAKVHKVPGKNFGNNGVWMQPVPEETKAFKAKISAEPVQIDWAAAEKSPFGRFLNRCGAKYQQYQETKKGAEES